MKTRVAVVGAVTVAALLAGRAGGASQAAEPQKSAVAPAATRAPSPQASAPAGNAENGKKLFTKYGCSECHGGEGQGSITGPRLGPNPLPLPAFVRYVRAPRGEMPPYTDKLLTLQQDLADIHAFLTSRPRPAPASVLIPQ